METIRIASNNVVKEEPVIKEERIPLMGKAYNQPPSTITAHNPNSFAAAEARTRLVLFVPDVYYADSMSDHHIYEVSSRVIIVRLSSKDGEFCPLLVYSPIKLDARLRAEIDGIGCVRYIIAPNKIHYKHIMEWAKTFQDAKIFAPPGLKEKRNFIPIDGILTKTPRPEWGEDLDQSLTQGNSFFTEVILFHRTSKTLIVGDWIENLNESMVRGCCSSVCKCFIPFYPALSIEHDWYMINTELAAQTAGEALSWNFNSILMCHGVPIVTKGANIFRDAHERTTSKVDNRGTCTKIVLSWISDYL